MKELGIYIHIPFCVSKCYYCDFYSTTAFDEKNIEKYILTTIEEIKRFDFQQYDITSIYIGGGTPSSIDAKYIDMILNEIYNTGHVVPKCEITIEVNPNSSDILTKLQYYHKLGINRLSIGLQSINKKVEKYIGRNISQEQFEKVYFKALEIGIDNISVDCITGLPNDTKETFYKTIEYIATLPNLKHVSMYSLEIHETTPLYQLVKNAVNLLPSEQAERDMYHIATRLFIKNGFEQYEISNYAKVGYESKHNLKYWKLQEYLGIGAGASSFVSGVRFLNKDNLDYYITHNAQKKIEEEVVSDINLQKEYMMLGLRLTNGINILEYIDKFGVSPFETFNEELSKLKQEKLIIITKNNIKLRKKAYDIANVVWREFV